MSERMTIEERRMLAAYEKTISRRLKAYLEVGNALDMIYRQELFRETHDSFRKYCQEKWNIDVTSAFKVIRAAEVGEALEAEGLTAPVRVDQAAQLAGLPRDKMKAAYRKAILDSNGKPTAKTFRVAVDEVMGRKPGVAFVFRKIALNPLEIEYLEAEATASGLNVSDVIRDILDRTIARNTVRR